MNILIENAESLELLASNNQWTKNATEGQRFGTTGATFDVAKKQSIGRFNLVCYIPQTRHFINMDHGRGKGLPEASPV